VRSRGDDLQIPGRPAGREVLEHETGHDRSGGVPGAQHQELSHVRSGERRQGCHGNEEIRGNRGTGGEGGSLTDGSLTDGYLMWTPEMARLMTSRWISEVPSKMV